MDKYTRIMPFGLVLLLSIKCIVSGTTFPDVALLAVLSSLGGYLSLSASNKQVKELEEQYVELKNEFNSKSKEVDDIKNHLSGLKLASAVRPASGRF